jgi:hypothetical protein
MKKQQKTQFPHDYICSSCAEKRGGRWPKKHVATMSESLCPYCKKKKGTCNIGDWDWTDGKARGMRD